MPWAALALMAAGLVALGSAFLLEHFFSVLPCILCYYERVPYALIIVFSVLALVFQRKPVVVGWLLVLSALALFIDSGIAFFHSGVELHWWPGTDECAVNPSVFADPAAARQALLETPVVRCDEISFTFLGLTLANWNVPLCLGLGFYALLAFLQPRVKALQPGAKGCCCRGCKIDKEV